MSDSHFPNPWGKLGLMANNSNPGNGIWQEVSKMAIWAWLQPVDRIWKVVSDNERGTLCVYNEKSELIMERKGMSKEEVSFVEQNFLQIVATNLSGNNTSPIQIIDEKKPLIEHNYMYV